MRASTSAPLSGETSFEETRKAKHRWKPVFFLAGAVMYLYASLFAFPNIPYLLEGDQTFFWVYGLRMLNGEQVYKDFFQFTPPGADIFFATLFKLLGPYVWVMNLAVLLLGVALFTMCFHLTKRLMGRDAALLASLLYVVFIYGDRLDATHHWFSLLAAMGAVDLLMPERTAFRIALAGALLGVASFFTQTVGVAGAFALLFAFAWEHFSAEKPWPAILKNQALLVTAFAAVWGALSAHFIASVGWKNFWYLQFTYPQHYVVYRRQFLFPDLHGLLTWRSLHFLVPHLSVYFLLLVIYPFVLWNCWRSRREARSPDDMQIVLLSMMGLFLLLGIITRVNWIRLYVVAMPGFIVLIWILTRTENLRRHATTAMWIVIACVAGMQALLRHHHAHRVADLPAGRVAVAAQDYEEFVWLSQHTSPGDYIFQTSWLNFYPPLELRSPVYIDGLWPIELTLPEHVNLTIRQLEQRPVKYILWPTRWSTHMADPSRPWTNHLGPFREYLTSRYVRVQVFANQDEVWERR